MNNEECENSTPNGKGTMQYAYGSKYVGFFKDSVRDGKGTYYFGIGNKIKYNFKDGNSPGFTNKHPSL